MKIIYKVIDTRTNEDITDKYDWVLQPNGRLAYNAYGDLIGLTYAEAVFNIEDIEQKQGKWIERIEKPAWLEDDVEVYYDCSCCGIHNFDTTPYCPVCGAKMSLEETNI